MILLPLYLKLDIEPKKREGIKILRPKKAPVQVKIGNTFTK